MTTRAGFIGLAGPAQRRQVDARQRDRRRQGGDRLRPPADHPPRQPRGRHRRRAGLAARARRPARGPAPARRAHRADAAPGRARARGRRRGPASSSTASRGWAPATASSPSHLLEAHAGRAGDLRRQQDRPPRRRRDGRGARRRPPSSTVVDEVFPISAKRGTGIEPLVERLAELVPEGPLLYPPEDRTDQPSEVHLAELIREQVLRRTHEELPHAVEVAVEEVSRARRRPGRGPGADLGRDRSRRRRS